MGEDKGSEDPKLTRREFLRRATKAGLGLAASSIAGGPLVAGLQKPQEKIKQPSFHPVVPTASSVAVPATSDITPEDTLTPVSETMVSEKIETQPTRPIPLKKELFFVGEQSKETVLDAQEKVDAQVTHYKKAEKDLVERINRTLKYREMIITISKKLGFKENSAVPELLLGLIFVESGGNPDAISGKANRKRNDEIKAEDKGSARGLCQVRPDTAKEVARRLGLQFDDNSLFNPETNITLALEHLDHLYKRLFPNLGVAFWAYHLGEGNMALAIETYLTGEVKVSKAIVDAILLNKEKAGTFDLVKNYELDFLKLINSKKVRERLRREKAFNDDTEFYVPRIGAAVRLLAS